MDKEMDENSKGKVKSVVKSDVIEIPVGKLFKGFRENPWMIATVVLGFVLVFSFFFGGSGVSGVGENEAGQNLVDFINSQGQGSASLVSASKQGSLYNVIVNYNGEDVPVYVSLDGQYLISDVVPLTGAVISDGGDNEADSGSGARINVEIGDSPKLGSESAQVVIVEFTDYQCPFCGRHFTDTYPQIKKDYIDTGKVLYVGKDFPLSSIHPQAQKAAESARCVREQKGDEGFWKMHDKLFINQNSLSADNYKKWARELGVEGNKFDSCLDSGKYSSVVQADFSYGSSLGISGTPGFFINGISVSGAQPYSVFKQVIDKELEA